MNLVIKKRQKRFFKEIHKLTKTPLELIPILFEIAQKEVKMQLLWTAASHNKDLYFQKIFEKMNSQMKNKILPKDILHIFDRYWKVFYTTIKRERATTELLKYLKRKGIKTWIVTEIRPIILSSKNLFISELMIRLILWSVQKRHEWINLILLLSCLQHINLRCLRKSVLWSETIFRKILMEPNGLECKASGSIGITKKLREFVQDLLSILQ